MHKLNEKITFYGINTAETKNALVSKSTASRHDMAGVVTKGLRSPYMCTVH
jgi:hypothetical protein